MVDGPQKKGDGDALAHTSGEDVRGIFTYYVVADMFDLTSSLDLSCLSGTV